MLNEQKNKHKNWRKTEVLIKRYDTSTVLKLGQGFLNVMSTYLPQAVIKVRRICLQRLANSTLKHLLENKTRHHLLPRLFDLLLLLLLRLLLLLLAADISLLLLSSTTTTATTKSSYFDSFYNQHSAERTAHTNLTVLPMSLCPDLESRSRLPKLVWTGTNRQMSSSNTF